MAGSGAPGAAGWIFHSSGSCALRSAAGVFMYTGDVTDGSDKKVSFIVRYPEGEDGLASGRGEKTAYAVVYVRPETNNVLYERAIVSGIRRMGDPVFMANINGTAFTASWRTTTHPNSVLPAIRAGSCPSTRK
jgi:hypothetical protein